MKTLDPLRFSLQRTTFCRACSPLRKHIRNFLIPEIWWHWNLLKILINKWAKAKVSENLPGIEIYDLSLKNIGFTVSAVFFVFVTVFFKCLTFSFAPSGNIFIQCSPVRVLATTWNVMSRKNGNKLIHFTSDCSLTNMSTLPFWSCKGMNCIEKECFWWFHKIF